MGRSAGMGLQQVDPDINIGNLDERLKHIMSDLEEKNNELLSSQNVRIISGTGKLLDAKNVEATHNDGTVESFEADRILLSTGSRPRIPEWCRPDGERILTTRDAYPPPEIPEHLTVVGSGVTGVEFVHMFTSLGSEVTLIVSRQHVLPDKDPELSLIHI